MGKDRKIAIVVSSHKEDIFLKYLDKWSEEFSKNNVIVYVNEDHPKKEFIIPTKKFEVKHFCWEDHKKDLGLNSWIIPHKGSAGKSFCFWKAYQDGAEYIISIDHDCYPDQKNTIEKHIDQLNQKVTFGWFSSIGTYTRGFPYLIRDKTEVVLNHGGWSNIPDFDGPQMLIYPQVRFQPLKKETKLIPKGTYFPMCGMNFSFKRKATPALYFLLQGPDYPFDRFDDIWAGIFFKKITDHLEYAIFSGTPSVRHDKLTDPFVAIRKETNGLEVNEWLWCEVDKIVLTENSFKKCYIELANGLKKSKYIAASQYSEYFVKLVEAMIIWAELFNE